MKGFLYTLFRFFYNHRRFEEEQFCVRNDVNNLKKQVEINSDKISQLGAIFSEHLENLINSGNAEKLEEGGISNRNIAVSQSSFAEASVSSVEQEQMIETTVAERGNEYSALTSPVADTPSETLSDDIPITSMREIFDEKD